MIVLVSKSAQALRAYHHHKNLGMLLVPGSWWTPDPAFPWACDNGAFKAFHDEAFAEMLDRVSGIKGCLWVAAPDVVGDAAATLQRFWLWRDTIGERHGLPIAFVGQDGLTSGMVPWGDLDCLFIGGTTEWKLGEEAKSLAVEAKKRGKRVHMGRVNSRRRIRYAKAIGCDSIDGTRGSRFTDEWLDECLRVAAGDSQMIVKAWERQ